MSTSETKHAQTKKLQYPFRFHFPSEKKGCRISFQLLSQGVLLPLCSFPLYIRADNLSFWHTAKDESVFLFSRLKEGRERLNCSPLTGTLPLIYTCVLCVRGPFAHGPRASLTCRACSAVPPRRFSRPTPTLPRSGRHTHTKPAPEKKSSLTWMVLISMDDGRRREAGRREREGKKKKNTRRKLD